MIYNGRATNGKNGSWIVRAWPAEHNMVPNSFDNGIMLEANFS